LLNQPINQLSSHVGQVTVLSTGLVVS